jgi:hypothetical protein
VWQWINLRGLAFVAVDPTEASKGVLSIDVHGARSANTLTTRTAKSKCRIYFVLDLDESVKNLDELYPVISHVLHKEMKSSDHRPRLVQINLVGLKLRLLVGLIWVLQGEQQKCLISPKDEHPNKRTQRYILNSFSNTDFSWGTAWHFFCVVENARFVNAMLAERADLRADCIVR